MEERKGGDVVGGFGEGWKEAGGREGGRDSLQSVWYGPGPFRGKHLHHHNLNSLISLKKNLNSLIFSISTIYLYLYSLSLLYKKDELVLFPPVEGFVLHILV